MVTVTGSSNTSASALFAISPRNHYAELVAAVALVQILAAVALVQIVAAVALVQIGGSSTSTNSGLIVLVAKRLHTGGEYGHSAM